MSDPTTTQTPALDAEAERLAAAREESESLFARCVVAVSDGICLEEGPNIRVEFFDQFGSDLAASAFLYLMEARAAFTGVDEEVFTESFLRSLAATVGKVGIRLSRGRAIPAAAVAAEAAVKMIASGKLVLKGAQEKVQSQAHAARQAEAMRSFTGAGSAPNSPGAPRQVSDNISALLKSIGG